MKTDKEIEEHYEEHADFYGDNWIAAFEEMIYFRQMIEQARLYVSRHMGAPQADEWLAKYQSISDNEDES